MRAFRSISPTRSLKVPQETDYTRYRKQLEVDFGGRCGYTDCSQMHWFGGFEIDHFAPMNPTIKSVPKKAAFRALECTYSNLVYACPSVNRAKGNDWPSDTPTKHSNNGKGYLDPCDNDYNDYFYRTDGGQIMPKSDPVAIYMWGKLNLYLKRYEIYWRIDWLFQHMDILQKIIKDNNLDQDQQQKLQDSFNKLASKYIEYMKYVGANYSEVTRS